MEARKLLEYYYNLILFRPDYPSSQRSDHLISDERTYVPYESIFGGESLHGYEVYIGKTETELLSRAIGDAVEDTQSDTYLCMLRTDKRGYYIRNSFFISPVLFALAKILKERNRNTLLDLNLINRANDEFDEFLTAFDRKLEYRELNEVFNYVVNKLNLSEFLPDFLSLIKERDPYGHNAADGYLMDLEGILSAPADSEKFELIAKSLRKVLRKASPLREEYTAQRVKEMTSPEKNSLGMWPGHDHLSLREQLVLNQLSGQRSAPLTFVPMVSRRAQALRLLPEMLTTSLIERAASMTRYSNPDDAFREVPFQDNKAFASSYHLPEDRLLTPGLILLGKGTDFIQDLERVMEPVLSALQPAPYFTSEGKLHIVTKLTSNRSVIHYVKDVFKAKGEGLDFQMSQTAGDWEETRQGFRELLNEVLRKREEILQEYRTTMGYQEVLEKVSSAALRRDELKARIESSEASKIFKETELEKRSGALEEHELAQQELENRMGFFKRWLGFLFPGDDDVVQRRVMAEKEKELEAELAESKRELNLVMTEYHDRNEELSQVEADYLARQSTLSQAVANIASYREKYGKAFADDDTLKKLVRDGLKLDSQLWVSEEYNDLRKKLLQEALKVHRSFISHSRAMKTNMSLFALLLEDRIQDRDLQKIYIELLKSATILNPLTYISTDYEPYFLSVASANDLGAALIPEAGKQPLAESMGPINRFQTITAFNIGEDHWVFPEVPAAVARNLSSRILGVQDPETLDLSLADVLNVLA